MGEAGVRPVLLRGSEGGREEGGREGEAGDMPLSLRGREGEAATDMPILQRMERERETAYMPLLLRERERERGAIWQKSLYLK